ncbi:Sb-PDE family phosphodiesterase [Niabella ginsengisoli]|uniref:Sb-PDE family phosphodiesterase n=1 Tax=Niabella ginsengisoli TaxID=522298 RepID=A0ABS9SJ50_9BACT|nr:Sb-PDE family phosphodiesterase [Niabella ginsengisoli]MCH5598380.1 Sb-PDE family phosphodiesterase [Niabella ginsengisoli]
MLTIENKFDIPFDLKLSSPYDIDDKPYGKVRLAPHEKTKLTLFPVWEYPETFVIEARVENILVDPETCLQTELKIKL